MTFRPLAPSDALYNYKAGILQKILEREVASGLVFDTVLIAGPAMTGKSTMLQELEHRIGDRPVVKWDAGMVLEHTFGRKMIDERLLGRLKRIENDVVMASREMYHDTLLVKAIYGLNSTLRSRETVRRGSTLMIVSIGPPEGIYERLVAYKPYALYHTESEARVASTMAETFALPTRNEGFAKIVYINSFGDDGVEWLSKRIEIKRT